MQRGTHFGLDDVCAAEVLGAANDAALRAAIERVQASGAARVQHDCDTAWDPITCALAPASGRERDPDEWPAFGVIRGDVDLEVREDTWMVTYVEPAHVAEVAAWLDTVDEAFFRDAYAAMPQELRSPAFGDVECAAAWAQLGGIRRFFATAAQSSLHVIFHVGGFGNGAPAL